MYKLYNNFETELTFLQENQQFRKIKNIDLKIGKYIFVEGKKLLNLSSNNYLGISDNTNFLSEFYNSNLFMANSSLGSTSARLLTGSLPVYNELEAYIAQLFKKDKTLIFNTGYQANTGMLSAIAQKGDVIFGDKLNHASIIDGIKLSGADFYRYKHLDYENLESLIIKNREKYKNAFLVTESVFSMDGDIADLKKLIELKNKYGLILIVDEAHAFGVFGEKGLGIAEQENLISDIDLLVATFGKSIGSTGAFIVGDTILIDYIINKARSFIFSTSLPPVNVAFSLWVLQNILPETLSKRVKMLEIAEEFRSNLLKASIKTFGSSHIVPVVIGDNDKTFEASQMLLDNGFFCLPIRPPTVPKGSSRLRLSFNTEINWDDLKDIPELLKKVCL